MKVTILDDYHDTLRTLASFAKLADCEVAIWNDHVEGTDTLATRREQCTDERSGLPAEGGALGDR